MYAGRLFAHGSKDQRSPWTWPSSLPPLPFVYASLLGSTTSCCQYLDDAVDRYIQWEDPKEPAMCFNPYPTASPSTLRRPAYVVRGAGDPRPAARDERVRRLSVEHTAPPMSQKRARDERMGEPINFNQPRQASKPIPKRRLRVEVLSYPTPTVPTLGSRPGLIDMIRQNGLGGYAKSPYGTHKPMQYDVMLLVSLKSASTTRPAKRANEYICPPSTITFPEARAAIRTSVDRGVKRSRVGALARLCEPHWDSTTNTAARRRSNTHVAVLFRKLLNWNARAPCRRSTSRSHKNSLCKLCHIPLLATLALPTSSMGLFCSLERLRLMMNFGSERRRNSRRSEQADPPTPQHAGQDSPARGLRRSPFTKRWLDKNQRGERGRDADKSTVNQPAATAASPANTEGDVSEARDR
ncbi:hypothetical protein BV25DRAFT_1842940 [Artomyces pyxidatus]|uniref:Uncharacterized protein n=1 Tax=Artomyces pyxidatus TaxID=48021 RepID=A0ACB8SIB1_9AGAM|nr:hypothetical protein BV25DRAFT_1842940 [Artomyces pyxidatus]